MLTARDFHQIYNNDLSIFVYTASATVQRTAESVLSEIFPCVVACGLVEGSMEDFTMQISGEQSYIAGSYSLIEFKDIRRYSSSSIQ